MSALKPKVLRVLKTAATIAAIFVAIVAVFTFARDGSGEQGAVIALSEQANAGEPLPRRAAPRGTKMIVAPAFAIRR